MRKIKFLPLLLIAPLLVGCKGNVKSPKFAKEGDKILSEKFIENFTKAGESSVFAKTEKVGSLVMKSKEGSFFELKKIRNKKAITDRTVEVSEDTQMKFDSKNSILAGQTNRKMIEQRKANDGKYKEVTKVSGKGSIQAGQINGAQYVLDVDSKQKMYSPEAELTGTATIADYLDIQIKQDASSYYSAIQSELADFLALPDNDPRIGDYTFYQNNNIFTLVIEHKEDSDQRTTDDKVIYTRSDYSLRKYQLDTTSSKMAYKTYFESKITMDFKLNYYEFAAGDISEQVEKQFVDGTIDFKDVKLKAVNISKYTAFGF